MKDPAGGLFLSLITAQDCKFLNRLEAELSATVKEDNGKDRTKPTTHKTFSLPHNRDSNN
jgi:hypothetical protein